jgi:ketosteroid isomerase-like protein
VSAQSNIETIRAMFEAFRRRDAAASAAPLSPAVVWDASRMPVEDLRGVYRGLEEVAGFWRRWLAAWETIELGEYELIDAGDHVVAWLEGQTNRGRGSGIEIKNPPYGWVYTFGDGKVIRVEMFMDRSEALVAAGLD